MSDISAALSAAILTGVDVHLVAEVVRLSEENERLRAALIETTDDLESWGAYASDYFQEKWDLAGDIARARAAASLYKEGK